jgi:hypothetical protein
MYLPFNWLFKQPIDLEHKKYVLLATFQKYDNDFDELKIYPSFTEISFHLADAIAVLNDGKFLAFKNDFEYKTHNLQIDELQAGDVPKDFYNTQDFKDYIEYSKINHMKYFGLFESLWKKLNWSTQVLTKDDFNMLPSGKGYMTLFYRGENLYYSYERKPKSTNSKHYYVEITPIKDLKNIDEILPILEIRTDDFFPLNESILPCIKSRIGHIIEETLRVNVFKKVI